MFSKTTASAWLVSALCALALGIVALDGCDKASWRLPTATPTIGMPRYTPDPEPPPTLVHSPDHTVVVLSWVGAQDAQVDAYRQRGILRSLSAMAADGVEAERLAPPYPAQSVPAHAVLATGVSAGGTGVVSQRFHLPGTAIQEIVDACERASYAIEPAWRRAMRRGLRTAVICWPGITPDQEHQKADYVISYGEAAVPAARHVISLTRTSPWPGVPPSYSPHLAGKLVEPSTDTVLGWVLAVDSANDRVTRYDRFYFTRAEIVDEYTVAATPDEWTPWRYADRRGYGGGWLLITNAEPSAFTIYQTEMRHSLTYPTILRVDLEAELGPPPQVPDRRALEWGWIDTERYIEMMQRRIRWVEGATRFIQTRYAPDLIYVAQDGLQEAHKALWLVDERQGGYTLKKATSYARALKRGYGLMDASLDRIRADIDARKTTLFLVSPHGQQPVHRVFNVNTLLQDKGFLVMEEAQGATLGKETQVVISETRAMATASGGLVNIYLNRKSREVDGIVSRDEAPDIIQEIAHTLGTVTDTLTGEPIFAFVTADSSGLVRGGEALAGDIIAYTRVGYEARDDLGVTQMLSPTDMRASDGYRVTDREMQGIFYAVGRDILQGATTGPVDARSLAPTIAELLGFDLQSQVTTVPLEYILR